MKTSSNYLDKHTTGSYGSESGGISRRNFLGIIGVSMGAGVLAACNTNQPARSSHERPNLISPADTSDDNTGVTVGKKATEQLVQTTDLEQRQCVKLNARVLGLFRQIIDQSPDEASPRQMGANGYQYTVFNNGPGRETTSLTATIVLSEGVRQKQLHVTVTMPGSVTNRAAILEAFESQEQSTSGAVVTPQSVSLHQRTGSRPSSNNRQINLPSACCHKAIGTLPLDELNKLLDQFAITPQPHMLALADAAMHRTPEDLHCVG